MKSRSTILVAYVGFHFRDLMLFQKEQGFSKENWFSDFLPKATLIYSLKVMFISRDCIIATTSISTIKLLLNIKK